VRLIAIIENFCNRGYGEGGTPPHHRSDAARIIQRRKVHPGGDTLTIPPTGVLQQLPQHEEGVLLGQAQGYEGITPYVRWGNVALLLMLIAMLAYVWTRRRPTPPLVRGGREGFKGELGLLPAALRRRHPVLRHHQRPRQTPRAHNAGTASKYTRTRVPVEPVYAEPCATDRPHRSAKWKSKFVAGGRSWSWSSQV